MENKRSPRYEAKERDRRESQLKRWRLLSTSAAALGIALIGTILAFVQLRQDRSQREHSYFAMASDDQLRRQEVQITALTAKLAVAMTATDDLQRALAANAHNHVSGNAANGLTIADRQSLDRAEKADADLNQRLTALEGALLQSPEKAIAVPLLHQQLIDIEDKNKGDAENVHGEINRLYGMMQWFLGLMTTLIIGVGGLVANSFRSGAERNKPKPEGSEQDPPKIAATPAVAPTS
jgi:hypothetical protein